jgi:hypothetical protein
MICDVLGRQHNKYFKINQASCLHCFCLITATCFGPYFETSSGSFIKHISCYWNISIWIHISVNHYNHHNICNYSKIVKRYIKFLKIFSFLQRQILCYLPGVVDPLLCFICFCYSSHMILLSILLVFYMRFFLPSWMWLLDWVFFLSLECLVYLSCGRLFLCSCFWFQYGSILGYFNNMRRI